MKRENSIKSVYAALEYLRLIEINLSDFYCIQLYRNDFILQGDYSSDLLKKLKVILTTRIVTIKNFEIEEDTGNITAHYKIPFHLYGYLTDVEEAEKQREISLKIVLT